MVKKDDKLAQAMYDTTNIVRDWVRKSVVDGLVLPRTVDYSIEVPADEFGGSSVQVYVSYVFPKEKK